MSITILRRRATLSIRMNALISLEPFEAASVGHGVTPMVRCDKSRPVVSSGGAGGVGGSLSLLGGASTVRGTICGASRIFGAPPPADRRHTQQTPRGEPHLAHASRRSGA